MSRTQTESIRGAIKTAISTSTDNLVAGEEFSIFVTVQNPFELPLTLHRVSTYLPTEFLDVDSHLRVLQVEELQESIADFKEFADEQGIDISLPVLPKKRFRWRIPELTRFTIKFPGLSVDLEPKRRTSPTIARDMTARVGTKIPFLEMSRTIQEETKGALDATQKERIEEELKRYEEAIDLIRNPNESTRTLQPGNSTVQTFTVKSRKEVLFKPAKYRLNIEIEYEVGGVLNTDIIEYTMQVRASPLSMILGALVGGFGGWWMNEKSATPFDLTGIVSLVGSLFLSSMVVVLLSRKKDIQSLVTVEDFWGGIVIGFLTAYSGPKLIRALV